MSDKEREEFESWYRSKYGAIGSYEKWRLSDVVYMFVAWNASAERYQSRIAELESEVVRLKVDADRYRFLRGCSFIEGGNRRRPHIHAADNDTVDCWLNGARADNKIDEAMKGGA